MWRRLRRRTMSPRRPVLYEGQYTLAIVTALVLIGSIALVVWVLIQS